ncbi:MAG: hypothetical protein IIB36_01145 [Gemmatimonadetes bacterium]|nr:hypothetical protein [Gemmatimonadota bacterium]
MSLVHFHRFLITTAIVFCLGYGAWELNAAADRAGGFIQGTVFIVLGLALAVYLRHLGRFLGYDE